MPRKFKSTIATSNILSLGPIFDGTIRSPLSRMWRGDLRRYPGSFELARKTPDGFGQTWTDWVNQKKQFKINKLSVSSNHASVLFVQHPPKNARNGAFRGGSFIACAGSFGNCGGATEGGIPKSSRLGRSLKSLAFMRVCPKARCDSATG